MKSKKAYLLIGGNLGDRAENLAKAITSINKHCGQVLGVSKVYETEPWGVEGQPNYLNQAIEIETTLDPLALLDACQTVEKELGRERLTRWGARVMDVDILFYESQIINTERLQLPHPRLHERNFVLVPLMDLIPEFEHPILKKNIEDIYWDCFDTQEVFILEEKE